MQTPFFPGSGGGIGKSGQMSCLVDKVGNSEARGAGVVDATEGLQEGNDVGTFVERLKS
jgi:hypothetical protein